MPPMYGDWTGWSHGVAWRLELERTALLPGRLVAGRVKVTAEDEVDVRGLMIALRAEEYWQHRVTTTDGQGHTSTRVVTERRDLVNEPVQVEGAFRLGRGESRTWPFELPVPPLGPASVEAEVAGLTWAVVARLDVPGGFDSSVEGSVRVVQPVALLRSGAEPMAEFALFPSADVMDDEITGTIELDPVPLCAGEPFNGVVTLHVPETRRLQQLRAEIRVVVKATVSDGLEETITVWSGILPGTELSGDQSIAVSGSLDGRALPTITLPHARAAATFHLILATAWARDPHLVRDVAIATTLEL